MDDTTEEGSLRLTGTLTFSGNIRLLALVDGGYFLPPLAPTRAFLMDSNAVSAVLDRSNMIPEERKWWEGMLSSSETVVNLFPKAFEGNEGGRFPTLEEFETLMAEDLAKFRSEFPNVTIVELSGPESAKVYELVAQSAEYGDRECGFLVEVAPLIAQHLPVHNFGTMEDKIFEIARNHGLLNDSLSLYLALSCLFARPGSEDVARKVLKPTQIVKKGNAHNPFADINLLRMFIASLALFSSTNASSFALLTGDRPLIALWCGLEVKNFRVSPAGYAAADFTFSAKMFPSLSEEKRSQLAKRVAAL